MPEDIEDQKRVEYYAAAVNAWFNTAIEYDKSLFAFSAAGIGLLFTLLTMVGVRSLTVLIFYLIAIVSFVVSLVAILYVFSQNKKLLDCIVNKTTAINEPVLSRLDKVAATAFGIGILFIALIGVNTALYSYEEGGNSMTKESVNGTKPIALEESFRGANHLQPLQRKSDDMNHLQYPQGIEQRSFVGAANLQPKSPTSTTNQPTPSQSTSTNPPASMQNTGKK